MYPFVRRNTDMCNLSEGVLQKGIAQGFAQGEEQGLLLCIKNVIDSLHWPIEQVMDALKIPDVDRERYRSLILKES